MGELVYMPNCILVEEVSLLMEATISLYMFVGLFVLPQHANIISIWAAGDACKGNHLEKILLIVVFLLGRT